MQENIEYLVGWLYRGKRSDETENNINEEEKVDGVGDGDFTRQEE